MKMITLPKLRDALLNPDGHVVKVEPEIAERARIPIERMVAINP
jgi:quinolinate synthase